MAKDGGRQPAEALMQPRADRLWRVDRLWLHAAGTPSPAVIETPLGPGRIQLIRATPGLSQPCTGTRAPRTRHIALPLVDGFLR